MVTIRDLPLGGIDLSLPEGVHAPSPSTAELARLLDVESGDQVLELGCGSGLLSIVAARLGAGRVIATDLDSRALSAAALNTQNTGTADTITLYEGSWYEALPEHDRGPFDVIIAIAPQTPGPRPFGPKYGGWDGTDHLTVIIDGAPACLKPETGRLWIMAISLVPVSSLLKRLRNRFGDVRIHRETERLFSPGEYDGLAEGLFDHLVALRDAGTALFRPAGKGNFVFWNYFIRSGKPRSP